MLNCTAWCIIYSRVVTHGQTIFTVHLNLQANGAHQTDQIMRKIMYYAYCIKQNQLKILNILERL